MIPVELVRNIPVTNVMDMLHTVQLTLNRK